jgi:hypothetical protein
MVDTETGRAGFRLRWYPRIILGTMVVVLVLVTVAGDGSDTATGRLGGDFPSFFGAGSIVAEGDAADLYDADAQIAAQADLLEEPGDYLYFAYPPFFSYPYAALSRLGYRPAFLLHTLLMGLALWGAVRLARPLVPRLLPSADHELVAVAISLLFYPILRSLLGGQNTTLTLLLLVAVWRLAADGRDGAAGLVLALMLYKPQFGLVYAALFLVARRWRIVAWWAGGAMALYLAAAIGFGAGWVGEWLDQVQGFGERNLEVNGDLMVSAIGFFQNLFGTGIAAFVVAGAVVIGVLALLLPPWWRRGVAPEAVGLAAAGLVLLAPSALYYDAGVAVLSLAIGLTFGYRHAVGFAVGAFIGSWSQLLASTLGFSPLFLLVVVVFLWAAWNERRPTVSPSTVG